MTRHFGVELMRALPLRAVLMRPIFVRMQLSWTGWGVLTVVLAGISAAIAVSGVTGDVVLVGAARALMVAVPMAVGVYAWWRRRDERFGPLLVAAGVTSFVTSLAESGDAVLYSIGRGAGWVATLLFVYVVVSFPSGRVTERRDVLLLRALAALLVVLYLPTLLLAEDFPLPSPFTSCQVGCPPNAFFALEAEPGFVAAVVVPLRELLTVVLFGAAAFGLAARLASATRRDRHALLPVLGVAIAWTTVLALAVGVRRWAPGSGVTEVAAWLIAFGMPALALGYVLGLVIQRFFLAGTMQRLTVGMPGGADAERLRLALASVFEDSSLQLAFRVDDLPGGWADADGEPVALPARGSGRSATEVHGAHGVVAAIVHDDSLCSQRELMAAAGMCLATALENARLEVQVCASERELRHSRERIVVAADDERRRIERDLHDGAQQRLVALRIEIELLEDLMRRDAKGGLKRLHALGDEVGETLDEIRSLARGVYPPLLADRGLTDALQTAALHAPLVTRVIPDGVTRHSPQIESAVYFAVLEALQNASKHAAGARNVTILLEEGTDLCFAVRDDGAGFDQAAVAPGAGLANMRDRLGAVDGEVRIDSAPGDGTVVSGRVPLS